MQNPLAPLYSLQFVILLFCASLYFKAAELENAPRMLWAGLSVAIFVITWRVLDWETAGNLMGQGALLAGITLVRVVRDFRKPS